MSSMGNNSISITRNCMHLHLLKVVAKSFSKYSFYPSFSEFILDKYCQFLINASRYSS